MLGRGMLRALPLPRSRAISKTPSSYKPGVMEVVMRKFAVIAVTLTVTSANTPVLARDNTTPWIVGGGPAPFLCTSDLWFY